MGIGSITPRGAFSGLARRVLIVEDDQAFLLALTRALTLSGYEVLGATDLAKASEQLILQPDFVLIDLKLPDGCGLELLSRIRRRNVPVIAAILTAADQDLLAQAVTLR